MQFVRQRLAWIAVVWVAAQLSLLAAAPISLVCHASPAAADEDACCAGLAAGTYCPMHKHQGGRGHGSPEPTSSREHDTTSDYGCKLQNCAPQPAGLEAFAAGPAILSEQPCTGHEGHVAIAGSTHEQLIARAATPLLPPPRS